MAPRLRTLYVGTETLGEASMQHYVLVLDGLTTQQVKDIAEVPIEHKAEGDYVPPILVFPFQVELPDDSVIRLSVERPTKGDTPTAVLLAATAEEALAWGARQPRGLSDVLVLAADISNIHGLVVPAGLRVIRLDGYKRLPSEVRKPFEETLAKTHSL